MNFNSGIEPVEQRVLVFINEIKETVGKESIIIMPDVVKSKHQIAGTRATIVAVSGMAFHDWKGSTIPKIGDIVLVKKYAGDEYVGEDGIAYRLINDNEIAGIITEKNNG